MPNTTPTQPSYLDLLEARVASKARKLTRVPVCLDPDRLTQLDTARQQLREAEKNQPAPKPGAPKPAVKMNATNPVVKARKHLDVVEESVREASLMFVLEGKDGDEIAASGLAEDDRYGIILLALKGVEDLDGNPIPEITPDKITQLLPTLSAGERALLYTGITMASAAPDFPTSRR